MHSLRTKITMLTTCVTIIAVVTVTLLSVMFIISNERREADQTLLLLCETGERNLDYYFNNVEASINKVADFARKDLEKTDKDELEAHVERMREYFDLIAHRTSGVLTYYYRIDPEFSKDVKGFWYTNLDGDDFTEHEVTDITQYDTADTSKLVWFTVPKATGEGIWLPPYITDNLDVRVISYNVPIYRKGSFVGVAGIEIDYSTMAEQVDNINLFSNGYAFLTDEEGGLIFHPHIDVATLTDETRPEVPDGLISSSTFTQYSFEGVKKEAAWLPLSNGMRLTVAAPDDEINGEWRKLIMEILAASIVVLVVISLLSMRLAAGITKPLEQLTAASEQVDRGNYDVDLDYEGDDELGRLTSTFRQLASHVDEHITDLSNRVYVDALTSVRNKGGFSVFIEELQKKIDDDDALRGQSDDAGEGALRGQSDDALRSHGDDAGEGALRSQSDDAGEGAPRSKVEFAVCVFDCDDLKKVNDRYGHDKGDIYLKNASRLICRVFRHSPVFRIGGDEFSAILQNEDYANREALIEEFERERVRICEATDNVWEQVHITMGCSVYDSEHDHAVIDTVRRADKDMYENKRNKKGL